MEDSSCYFQNPTQWQQNLHSQPVSMQRQWNTNTNESVVSFHLQNNNYPSGNSTPIQTQASNEMQRPTNQVMHPPPGYSWYPHYQQPMYNYPAPNIQPPPPAFYYSHPGSGLSYEVSQTVSENYAASHGINAPPAGQMSVDPNFHPSFEGKIQTQQCIEHSDEGWIKDWLSSKQITSKLKEAESLTISITISEAKQQLRRAFSLLNQLSKIKESLELLLNSDETVWKGEMRKLQPIQEELMKIMTIFSQQKVVDRLKKQLTRINKKRARLKQQRVMHKQQALEKEKERLELENALHRWKEQMKEKLLQNKMEKQMKAEADAILSEVRRKISEAKKARERIRLLEKLRHVRKDSVQRKAGLFPSNESDKVFAEKIALLKQLVQDQLITYEAEERALQVMLETEQEGQKEQEMAQKQRKLQDVVDQREDDVTEGLFGSLDTPDQHDPLYCFWQYYTQAETNLESLVRIRHDWDIFLVPPNDEEGSSIPPRWVVPDQPSSAAWASVLQETK